MGFVTVLLVQYKQSCRGYGYPWIYPCVDIRLRPSRGYIHGYFICDLIRITDITKKFHLKSELLDEINAVENFYNRREDKAKRL